ncbi:hypothetical protein [Bacillus sp. AFS055030]|uniref:hypothetical protein n=1 Tax=Bacillus sp. AFS055030 TaxID=2033507 RepID=UPI0015D5027A|nr:hypothetical protein [Bacillus sp. AFS055030]
MIITIYFSFIVYLINSFKIIINWIFIQYINSGIVIQDKNVTGGVKDHKDFNHYQ